MRASFSLALLFALTLPVLAQDPVLKAKATAALELASVGRAHLGAAAAKGDCNCGCDGDCRRCVCALVASKAKAQAELLLAASACNREAEIAAKKASECMDDVAGALERARAEQKPLFLWVGMTCVDEPDIRKEWQDAVHCHADSNNEDPTPRLLVLRPGAAKAECFKHCHFGAATPAAIRKVLEPKPAAPSPVLTLPWYQNRNCSGGPCPSCR